MITKIYNTLVEKIFPEPKPKDLAYWIKNTEITDDLIPMNFTNVGEYKKNKDYRQTITL